MADAGTVPVTAGDPQATTLAFLATRETYGPGIEQVERIDTHISSVFLAGDRAWKLKRAVRLPFLDYSTLAQREAACRAELEINRRFAPPLYLDVVAVTDEGGGRLALDGQGPAVDWLVKMARFPEAARFDRLLESGGIGQDLAWDVADAIADLHRQAEIRAEKGGVPAFERTIAVNMESLRQAPDGFFTASELAELDHRQRDWLVRRAPLIGRRRDQGRVRRCHGDLHLANLCLFEGRPLPFDAIEFSEDFACIDVFYDLAFLLMDIDGRGHRPLASLILNRYLERGGDYEGVALLPLFLSLRAGIRALVAAAMPTAATDPTIRVRARGYFEQASAYLAPPPARLVAVGGLSGTGKSRMGRALAPLTGSAPGALVLRSDVIRKQLFGVGPEERLPPEAYGAEIGARTYATLYEEAERALRTGHSVIADAVFARAEQRDELERIAARAGVAFDGLWLEVPPEIARARITARTRNASDATPEVLDQQLAYDLGAIGWARIDASGPREATLKAAREQLGL